MKSASFPAPSFSTRARTILRRLLPCVLPALLLVVGRVPARSEEVRVQASVPVTPLMVQAAPALREENVTLRITSGGSSSQAIAAVGTEMADVAVSLRELTSADRATYPARRFEERRVGAEVFALVVSADVWESGVRALSREQMSAIYEGRVTNWKDVGGPDRELRFFAPEHGKATWEQLVRWLYGDVRLAPECKAETVNEPQEAREHVEFRNGALALVPPTFSDERKVFTLGIKTESGEILRANAEGIASGKYPMSRPVSLIVGSEPTGAIKRFLAFFAGERGREVVIKAGLVPLQP